MSVTLRCCCVNWTEGYPVISRQKITDRHLLTSQVKRDRKINVEVICSFVEEEEEAKMVVISGWYYRPPAGPRLPLNGSLCTLHSRCALIGEEEPFRPAVQRTHPSLEGVPRFSPRAKAAGTWT